MSEKDINNIYAEYCNEHYETIKKVCSAMLREYPDYAEDCVQDAFEVLLNKLRDGTEITYVKAFLIKTAKNLVLKAFKKIQEEQIKKVPADGDEAEVAYEQMFFENISDDKLDEIKENTLRILSPEEKELLELMVRKYRTSAEKYQTAAEKLGCSESTVRRRYLKLQLKITNIIDESFGSDMYDE